MLRGVQGLVIIEEVVPAQPGASKRWHPIELVKGISPDFSEDFLMSPSAVASLGGERAHRRDGAKTLQTPSDCLDPAS